jgi:hypothetical protein
LVQFLAGQRVVRGRPLVVDQDTLLKNLDELKARVAGGYLEISTTDGRKVNLDTLEAAPAPVVPPLPVFLPDSAKNDPPTGRPLPIFPDGAVQSTKPPVEEPKVDVQAVTELPSAAPTETAEEELEYKEPAPVTQPEYKGSGRKGRR